MKRTLVAILAISAFFLALPFNSCVAGTDGGHIEPRDGGYEVGERFISFFYSGETALSITDYEVRTGPVDDPTYYSVFDQIDIQDFKPAGAPTYDEMIYSMDGEFGIAWAHDIPMGIMAFETYVQNQAQFRVSSQMGAISSEKSVVVGEDDFRADLILLGSGNLTKVGQDISIQMEPSDSFFFRTAYVYEDSIGSDIARGRIAGELYVDFVNQSLAQAVVEYQPIDMEVQYSSSSRVEVGVDASFQDDKSVVLTLDKSVFDVPLEDLEIKLDGRPLKKAENVKGVLASSEESYYVLQNDDATQVFVNIPHFSQRTITISRIGPTEIGIEVFLGATASLLLVVAAAVFLFKRKD